MPILLLGGTGDALHIARQLDAPHVYSLAGLGRTPGDLRCRVKVGGFGGAQGLAQFIAAENIELLVDATHPYAARISANVAAAAARQGIPLWALRRPAWQPQRGDDWREFSDWAELCVLLQNFRRPFFTLGREPLAHLDDIPASQHWTVRCLDAEPGNHRADVIGARGPFTVDDERTLFTSAGFDVLISKNSGGDATQAKLAIARELQLPVLMQRRPPLPAATREFESGAALLDALAPFTDRALAPPLRALVPFAKRKTAIPIPTFPYHAGIGCRRGVSAAALRELLEHALKDQGLPLDRLAGLASIDSKRFEPGLQALAAQLKVPLRFFSAKQLAAFEHLVSERSAVALRETGVAGIAETSALAACGAAGKLIGRKYKTVAATCAFAHASGDIASVSSRAEP